MEDQPVLGGVPLGLEGPEERLLRPQDLHGGGGALRQVSQASGVRDQPGADGVANQDGQVRGHHGHLGAEVGRELLPVVRDPDDPAGEHVYVEEVDRRDVHTHAGLARIDDGLGPAAIHQDGFQLLQLVNRQLLPVLDQLDAPGEQGVLGHDLDQLGEVVAVPLPDPHAEGVDVLVELVQQGDALDDHVVALVHVELDLAPAVAVRQAELGLIGGHGGESLDQLGEVHPDPTEDLRHHTDVAALKPAGVSDGGGELRVSDPEDGLALGHVGLQEHLEVVTDDPLADGVDVVESIAGGLEGIEADQVDDLAI